MNQGYNGIMPDSYSGETNILLGLIMLYFIWLPGFGYYMINDQSETHILIPLLFPLDMLKYGIGSLCIWNLNQKNAFQTKFLEMKEYEALIESSFQLIFNCAFLTMGNKSIISLMSVTISFITLCAGIFGKVSNASARQKKIVIQLLGKILITLIATSLYFSLIIFFLSLGILISKSYNEMPLYFFVLCIVRVLLTGPFYVCNEFAYMFNRKTRRQRNPAEWSTLFQPLLVDLNMMKIKDYIIYILLKIIPNIVIPEAIALYDAKVIEFHQKPFLSAVFVVNYTMVTLILILHLVYLYKPDWFYMQRPSQMKRNKH